MTMKLFEYVILHHPKVVKDAQGNETQGPDKLLNGVVKQVMAVSEKQVAMLAAREIPDAFLDQLEEVEICVRPF
jgi:hypothetical protein